MGGEAKVNAERKAKIHEVIFSYKELVTLAVFLLANVKPANRSERRRYETMFDELQLDDIVEQVESADGLKTAEVEKRKGEILVREITGSTLDYLREKLDAQTAGVATLILGRIDRRLEDAKDGKRVAPDARPNGESAAPEAPLPE